VPVRFPSSFSAGKVFNLMRKTIAVFALLLVALQLELWFGDDRLPGLHEQQRAVASQSARNQGLLERNQDLKAEIISLVQGKEAAEERARSELGMMRPDEIYYQIAEVE
jgi:cell division protein FtsB